MTCSPTEPNWRFNGFGQATLLEVRERGYTILKYFAETFSVRFFLDIKVPFDETKHPQLAGRSHIDFLCAFLETLYRSAALHADRETDCNTILNITVEVSEDYIHRTLIERYSSNNHLTMETMMLSWLWCFQCLFDLYVGLFLFVLSFALANDRMSQISEIRWLIPVHREGLSDTAGSQRRQPKPGDKTQIL